MAKVEADRICEADLGVQLKLRAQVSACAYVCACTKVVKLSFDPAAALCSTSSIPPC